MLDISEKESKKILRDRLKFLKQHGHINGYTEFMAFIKENKTTYIRAEQSTIIDLIPYPVKVQIESGTTKEIAIDLLSEILESIKTMDDFNFHAIVIKDEE